MIIYREQKNEAHPEEYISRIRSALREYERSGFSEHSHAVDVLVELGEFETAVSDALSPEKDGDAILKQFFRRASVDAGRLFFRSWEGIEEGRDELAGRLHEALDWVTRLPLPRSMHIGIPEGFVYYGLYPETYLEAAKRFHRELSPSRIVCIGLRNIGTSLSAVVAATLQELGCEVRSLTVRPRGHPFDRHLALSGELESYLASLAGWFFLLIDEGPGLSGSSFGCTARKLSELGHPDKKIIYFPSWEPEHLGFASETTMEHWRRHRKYSADFDEVCLESGKLFSALSGEFLDLSAGRWRTLFYSDSSEFPAVFPSHERRKFLSHNGFCRKVQGWKADVEPGASVGRPPRSSGCLLKFAGLGRYGRETFRLAELLAHAGFSPPVVGLVNGFLVTRFVTGKPLTGRERNSDLLDTIARYLAFLKNTFCSENSTPYEQLREMVYENVLESMGEVWTTRLDVLEALYKPVDPHAATAIDGRMFPHEWISSSGGYLKTDGANHFHDHFFPGCQDIAWDIIGTFVEFGLNLTERKYLVQQYITLTGDKDILRRLPFFRIVYLSYRLGYASEAANALSATPDGERFGARANHYRALLRSEIVYLSDTPKEHLPYGILPST
ncbi:MAG: hypothetical protein ACYC9O_15620, partial [Candidatus Latescibacterota bacterium]